MTTAIETRSKGQQTADDVASLLKARNPILWIVTREEARVEGFIAEAADAAGYVPKTWDVGQGICDMNGKPDKAFPDKESPDAALAVIREFADPAPGSNQARKPTRGVWIMRDLPAWLTGPGGITFLRQVRNLGRLLPGVPREFAQAIIVLTPSGDVPAELMGHATVIEWPLPDRTEIAATLDATIANLPSDLRDKAAPNGTRDAAIDAAIGLSGEEAAACYARSLVQTKRIDPTLIANEKKRIIARERVLEWFDPLPGGLDAVGGLENLKSWAIARKSAYSPAARAYGLPAPKGALVVGVSGCGKSLFAKAVATAYGVPLLKFDLGALKSKFVGDSEANIRKAFRVIEAIGRCVVWLDEIEKALQGATSGSADGGVSSDALGAILNWMQERKGEAFVIATANDASVLPPELLRKGRFDEIWYVDVPNAEEREAVLKTALTANGRESVKIDVTKVADACKDFTGAEIAAIVPDALFAAFADNAREITTADLLTAARTVVPLTKTAAEKIEKLRKWANERARPATRPMATEAPKQRTNRGGRALDI